MKSRLAALLAVVVLALAGCSSGATPSPSVSAAATPPATIVQATGTPTAANSAPVTAAPASLTIYGAASLTAALASVKTTYEAANPGTTLTISTDSSTALETKIEQGAPADVFLSADTANPQKLVDKGLAAGNVTKFAGNLLTVIVPAGNPAGIKTPADLARSGVKVIAAGDAVPITKYASQLVANLAKQAGYPADFVAKYTANIVSKQDNVSAVVSQIALGEGDAGVVYVTDAKTSTRVATVEVPAAANVPATYGGVVIKASSNVGPAQAFLAWLAGPDGQAILAALGFLPPS
jgi:molybdate transport system substrate-binding protein